MRLPSRVVAIAIARDFRMFADSTGTYKVEDLSTPQFADLLPYAESMQLQWLLEDVAVNEIDWNLDAYPGWDRDHELAPVALFAADQTAIGSLMSNITTLTPATHYMRHLRLQLRWRLRAGVTVPKEAKFSAVIYVTLKGV